jgi:selenocysteine lyase/cysteine desulfurase
LIKYGQDEMEIIKGSGEENAGGIAALGRAMLILQRIGFRLIEEEEMTLTAKVMNGLSSLPDVTIYGITDTGSFRFRQKTGVIAFDVKNRMAGSIARKLSYEGGIGIRFGCHCAHLIVKHVLNFSPAQEAIQKLVLRLLPFITLQGMSRVSFGLHNTEQDADELIAVLRRIILKMQHDGVPNSKNENKTGRKQATKAVKKQINEFIAERERLVYV